MTGEGATSRAVWTIAEQHEGRLTRISYELLAWGRRLADKLGGGICSVVLGAEVNRDDLQRLILTGSFGSQLNVEAVVGLGMIPAVDLQVVEPSANGAGLGAALFLDDNEFARGERIAAHAEQIDLDQDTDFISLYISSMELPGD